MCLLIEGEMFAAEISTAEDGLQTCDCGDGLAAGGSLCWAPSALAAVGGEVVTCVSRQ